jgi:hypothetical protein
MKKVNQISQSQQHLNISLIISIIISMRSSSLTFLIFFRLTRHYSLPSNFLFKHIILLILLLLYTILISLFLHLLLLYDLSRLQSEIALLVFSYLFVSLFLYYCLTLLSFQYQLNEWSWEKVLHTLLIYLWFLASLLLVKLYCFL